RDPGVPAGQGLLVFDPRAIKVTEGRAGGALLPKSLFLESSGHLTRVSPGVVGAGIRFPEVEGRALVYRPHIFSSFIFVENEEVLVARGVELGSCASP